MRLNITTEMIFGAEDYINSYTYENTKKSYRTALKQYFTSIYDDIDDLNEISKQYILEGRDYRIDISKYKENILLHVKCL